MSKAKSEVCRSWSRDVEALGILKSVGVPICAAKIDDHGLARGDRYPLYSDIDLGDSERKEYRRFARSEEHTSELQSLMLISYAVFCLKKKKTTLQYIKNINTY